MSMRFPLVLMLTALGCAAPALASDPKTGDAPREDAPSQEPDERAPEEGEGDGPAAPDEDGPPHEEPEAEPDAPPEKPAEDEPEEPPKEEPKPVVPPAVTLSEPEFINGDVPAVANILKKTLGDVAQCVTDHGGLESEEGGLKVQFLVRARGRAEGVEVLQRHGVSKDAGRCVQALLKNKWVGMPSVDPTGVTFRYDMKPKK